jgi:hypothetical protein
MAPSRCEPSIATARRYRRYRLIFFQAVIDRRAEAAAVSAMASASQHMTMRAISHPRADSQRRSTVASREAALNQPKRAKAVPPSRPLNTSRPTHAAGTARPRERSRRERQCSCAAIFLSSSRRWLRSWPQSKSSPPAWNGCRTSTPEPGDTGFDDVIIRAAAKPVPTRLPPFGT